MARSTGTRTSAWGGRGEFFFSRGASPPISRPCFFFHFCPPASFSDAPVRNTQATTKQAPNKNSYAQLYKRFNLNSGLFFARSNDRTLELMRRLEHRLSREKYWDQTAYNEELFFLSHGDYTSPQATARVMDIYSFMNSKVLFKDVRRREKKDRPAKNPCMVHINYHPDKHARMKAVLRYYSEGDEHALDGFPGGSEPGT
jgi:hypothetical protein